MDDKKFESVSQDELKRVDGGNGFYASVGSSQIIIMNLTETTLGENSPETSAASTQRQTPKTDFGSVLG